MANENKGNVFAIAIMFMLFFMIAFVTNFAGSMGIIVKNQFGASNTASQFGSAANFFAYLFMGIPGGLILKRKGYKFTALLAVGVGIAGLAVQLTSGFVSSFTVYVTGAFIAGFSMCLLNLVVNPLLNTLGGGGNKGNQLVQFGCSLNSIGATLAPILLGYLIGGEVAKAKVMDAAPAMYIAIGIFVLMLTDLMKRGVAKRDDVYNVVLDEADEMLNMGFQESINEILENVPEERNTLLFSASMSA